MKYYENLTTPLRPNSPSLYDGIISSNLLYESTNISNHNGFKMRNKSNDFDKSSTSNVDIKDPNDFEKITSDQSKYVHNDRLIKKVNTPEWLFQLSNRMENLAKKENGWKGLGSIKVLANVENNANTLLRALALERIGHIPKVGLDFEGTFSFFWKKNDLMIDLTVYDDGTYSFFATNGDESHSEDEVSVSKDIPNGLKKFLTV